MGEILKATRLLQFMRISVQFHCETSRRFVDSCITQARVGDTWHTSSAIHCSAVPSPCPPPPHHGDADTFNHPGQIISRKMLQRWENSTFKTQQPNRIEDGQNKSFLFNFEALWRQCMNMKIKLCVGSPNDENDDAMAWQEEVSQL